MCMLIVEPVTKLGFFESLYLDVFLGIWFLSIVVVPFIFTHKVLTMRYFLFMFFLFHELTVYTFLTFA